MAVLPLITKQKLQYNFCKNHAAHMHEIFRVFTNSHISMPR